MDDRVMDIPSNINELEGLDNSEVQSKHKLASKNDSNNSPSTTDVEKRKLEDQDEDAGGGEIDGEELSDTTVKKQKISMSFHKVFGSVKATPEKKSPVPITIKLGTQKTKDSKPTLKKTSASVASAFNQDSDEEEMPPEAKMRMRNIGRDTPTSAGPNSFGKTRQGFCDSKKVFERQLKKKMDEVSDK